MKIRPLSKISANILVSIVFFFPQHGFSQEAQKSHDTSPWMIGFEIGESHFDFANKIIDGINPHDVYDQTILLHGLKFMLPLENREDNTRYLMLKLLGGGVKRSIENIAYATQPNITFVGLHNRNKWNELNLGLLTSFGLSFIDYSVVEVKNKTNKATTYTKGFESIMTAFEFGGFYSLTRSWDLDLLLNLNFKAETRDAYMKDSIALLFAVNYKNI